MAALQRKAAAAKSLWPSTAPLTLWTWACCFILPATRWSMIFPIPKPICDVHFYGKKSHAATWPEEGISALTPVLELFNTLNALRLEIADRGKILGIIRDGGRSGDLYSGSLFGGIYHSFLQYEIQAGTGGPLFGDLPPSGGVDPIRGLNMNPLPCPTRTSATILCWRSFWQTTSRRWAKP